MRRPRSSLSCVTWFCANPSRRNDTSYNYATERPAIFTETGIRVLFLIRDAATRLLDVAGAVRSAELLSGITGESWLMMACLDYLIETKELREITQPDVWGQHRVFIRAGE